MFERVVLNKESKLNCFFRRRHFNYHLKGNSTESNLLYHISEKIRVQYAQIGAYASVVANDKGSFKLIQTDSSTSSYSIITGKYMLD